MRRRRRELGVLALIVLAVSCRRSGDDGPGLPGPNPSGPGALFTNTLEITGHSPSSDAVQVDRNAPIAVHFASVIVQDCLLDPDTWLRRSRDDLAVAGSYDIVDNGRSILFRPSHELDAETAYTFQLSALTCDVNGLLLEEEYQIHFRTYDSTPPFVEGASVTPNTFGVNRYSSFTITFNEEVASDSVDSSSVFLKDSYGNAFSADLSVIDDTVLIDPCADLPGNRVLTLTATSAVADTAGNKMPQAWSVSFTTLDDILSPYVASNWSSVSPVLSPLVQPTIEFNESMDLHSVEAANVQFVDAYANIVSYRVEASKDQKTIRIVPSAPLVIGRTYSISLQNGPGAVTDVTGNTLSNPAVFSFVVGSDDTAPQLTATFPTSGTTGFSVNGQLVLSFDEALDAGYVNRSSIRLNDGTKNVDLVASPQNGLTEILVVPTENLTPSTTYTLTILGGQEGLRDPAGNPLEQTHRISFVASVDSELPKLIVLPSNGSVSVPTGVGIKIFTGTPLMASTVSPGTFIVTTTTGKPVPGTLSLTRNNRVIEFDPTAAWEQGTWYKLTILGGPDGVKKATGNWLTDDLVSTFRIGYSADLLVPEVKVTLNDIHELRNEDLAVPPHGFSINVSARDFTHYSLDMSSVLVQLNGPGGVPSPEQIFLDATVDGSTLSYTMPLRSELTPGLYTLSASVSDLSGNVGYSGDYEFTVHDPAPVILPFERTQVVWLRTDLDRNNNNIADFDDDLLLLGLITAGDPAGTNARMVEIMRDAITAQSYAMFARKQNGGRQPTGSVAIRLSYHQPRGIFSAQIALGGMDPEGSSGRKYGDDSTGTLGRAFFDYRNGSTRDENTATRPGLGVFPGELFLFESQVHIQVYPSFLTAFARRFTPLAPAMGGTPAGSHSSDPIVVAKGFDYSLATSTQRARFDTVFTAADDWAVAIGTILAHEIGHTVGLVARNKSPSGLHGDASLHNEFSAITDVMGAAVGYDSLISLDYEFRDLNIAYLRHRVLLK